MVKSHKKKTVFASSKTMWINKVSIELSKTKIYKHLTSTLCVFSVIYCFPEVFKQCTEGNLSPWFRACNVIATFRSIMKAFGWVGGDGKAASETHDPQRAMIVV